MRNGGCWWGLTRWFYASSASTHESQWSTQPAAIAHPEDAGQLLNVGLGQHTQRDVHHLQVCGEREGAGGSDWYTSDRPVHPAQEQVRPQQSNLHQPACPTQHAHAPCSASNGQPRPAHPWFP